eukprot:1032207_1
MQISTFLSDRPAGRIYISFVSCDQLEGNYFCNGNTNVFIHNPTANETIQINRESKERRYHFATDTPSHIRLYGRYLDIALRGQRDDLLSITVRGQRDGEFPECIAMHPRPWYQQRDLPTLH